MQEVCGERNAAHSANGIAYGKGNDLFSGIEKVCDLIETADWATLQV